MFVETLRLNVQNEFNTYTSREQISLFRSSDDIDQVRCLPLAHQFIKANESLSEILENICKENKFHLKGTIKTSIKTCEKKRARNTRRSFSSVIPCIYV